MVQKRCWPRARAMTASFALANMHHTQMATMDMHCCSILIYNIYIVCEKHILVTQKPRVHKRSSARGSIRLQFVREEVQ